MTWLKINSCSIDEKEYIHPDMYSASEVVVGIIPILGIFVSNKMRKDRLDQIKQHNETRVRIEITCCFLTDAEIERLLKMDGLVSVKGIKQTLVLETGEEENKYIFSQDEEVKRLIEDYVDVNERTALSIGWRIKIDRIRGKLTLVKHTSIEYPFRVSKALWNRTTSLSLWKFKFH